MSGPSLEQKTAIASAAEFLVIQAFAGTGKTYTLEGIAHANPSARILLLAYSKAIQLEATGRFPDNVEPRTTHSIAWGFGARYKDAGKLGNIKPYHIMRAYEKVGMTAAFARALLDTVEAYMHSEMDEIEERHVPAGVAPANVPTVLRWARERIWPGMCDLDNRSLPMPHDGYLKLYQLSHPNLSRYYDIILLDEAQDANAVTLDIFLRQGCRLVMVGDRHQSIFGFRLAVNAMDRVKADEVVTLTESRRFGPGIAKLATVLLSTFRDEKNPVRSAFPEKVTRYTVDRNAQHTLIGRTNGQLFRQAVSLIGQKRLYFVGGLENYPFERLVDVWHLMNGRKDLVRDEFFRTFKAFKDLEDYASQTEDKEIFALIGVVADYGSRIPALVEKVKSEAIDHENRHRADVWLSTAHRSKGLEFRQVVLLDDFEEFITEEGDFRVLNRPELVQELNLLYVALTRAEEAIELNSQMTAILSAVAARDAEAHAILARAMSRDSAPGASTEQRGEALGSAADFRYSARIGTRAESDSASVVSMARCALTGAVAAGSPGGAGKAASRGGTNAVVADLDVGRDRESPEWRDTLI